MNCVLAQKKGKQQTLCKILTGTTLFPAVPDTSYSRAYDDDYKLKEDEWFVIDDMSQKDYCLPLLCTDFDINTYSFLPAADYKKIGYIVSIQDDGQTFLFQNVTPSQMFSSRSIITWKLPGEINVDINLAQGARLVNNEDAVIVKQEADCIYRKDEDKLYFKNLNSITSIFNGISVLYREATDAEVDAMLAIDMVSVAPEYTKDKIKTANRRKIKQALERYNNLDNNGKREMREYIKDYCPALYDYAAGRFTLSSEEQMTDFLNGINERYYTTKISNEKRVANSVSPVK